MIPERAALFARREDRLIRASVSQAKRRAVDFHAPRSPFFGGSVAAAGPERAPHFQEGLDQLKFLPYPPRRLQTGMPNTTAPLAHILIAEDNADDLLLLRRAFLKAGHAVEIHAVPDGEEAMAYLAGTGRYADRTQFPQPEIIILDIKMPRRTGLEVLQWLKENPRHQVIPTVVMSASCQPTDVQASYDLGASTYFMKPGNVDELLALVKILSDYWRHAQTPKKAFP